MRTIRYYGERIADIHDDGSVVPAREFTNEELLKIIQSLLERIDRMHDSHSTDMQMLKNLTQMAFPR